MTYVLLKKKDVYYMDLIYVFMGIVIVFEAILIIKFALNRHRSRTTPSHGQYLKF